MADGEGAGESCWPTPATADSGHGGGGGGVLLSDVRREIYDRLRAVGNQEALADPFFNRVLEDNYQRLPPRSVLSAHPPSTPAFSPHQHLSLCLSVCVRAHRGCNHYIDLDVSMEARDPPQLPF
ncbi:uncharacterized protein LOC123405290 isoform X1 [Hordeum vulgare subsp. vulgare]|uniref:uncharacterized protein LOC123405290 isoform X1 n=1 Tax=Hordeum vulgare subsp. vulgare TaxID=112509 RepID=UPI001D1A4AF0|nr:uncharacterized protein LOC123405290 isoform X1 [Hordeum vulgare subsp. vulgare]